MNKHYKKWKQERSYGYGFNLYRDTSNGVVAGVCAGLADHFDIDRTIMRVIFVAAFIFASPLVFWGYLLAWVIISPRKGATVDAAVEYDEEERCYRKKNMFRYKESASERLRRARTRLDEVAQKVSDMEHYVTSKKFDLNREFANLDK